MSATRQLRPAAQPGTARLGERVRQLRVAAGLTQTDLAGDRFSKEYVSQIERGKTRPTRETVEWLAGKLGVDAAFLEKGVSADERSRVEAMLARAEALANSHQYDEAIEELENSRTAVLATGAVELEARAIQTEAWARMERGEIRPALDLLERCRTLTEGPGFSDVDRAQVLFRMGSCRYHLSSIASAVGLFSEALKLCESSQLPCDLLRSEILNWRSRCYRRQRDLEAAREDVERALELAAAIDDERTMASVYLQASLVSERMGHWVLARSYAERAKAYCERLNDERNVGRLLNNLGGLNFQLGNPERAVEDLKSAYRVLLEKGSDAEAGNVVSSLAHVHLATGQVQAAEEEARHALDLLADREDFLVDIAPTQLVLGRALLEQGRLDEAQEMLRTAEASAEQLESISHRAAAWMAQGDLAARRGEDATAARLYRNAAEALQDVRF
ncbi:MAG TPA: tetratricopeptide repeat protein [Gaiellaceae bacterium]|jgi:tetratricopeptide (TPR) repeat protein|nr:tetratricopeptide repeat protein [Gaiellaceae bacterium]